MSITMDVFRTVYDYINRIFVHVRGMKSLLLDSETIGMVGVVYSVSDALTKEVFLTENIDKIASKAEQQAYTFPHLTAVVIIQPSIASQAALITLLQTKRYHQYHLFFTNIVSTAYLDKIAARDQHNYIKSVYEYYMDFYAMSPTLYHMNNSSVTAGLRTIPTPTTRLTLADKQSAMFDRDVNGIIALCLSQKKRPDIRYSSSSHQAQTVALQCFDIIKEEAELFSYTEQQSASGPSAPHSSPSALLLILDRRDDPVTPLLSQWTYQAMIHELLTINNNRIDMKKHDPSYLNAADNNPSDENKPAKAKQIHADLQELVLSTEHDHFFAQNMFATFGDMGVRVKQLVEHYQEVTHSNHTLDSMDALQDFIDKYPQYRQLSGNVSKHVTLMTELMKIVNRRKLMMVSAVEQEIVCGNMHEHDELVDKIKQVLQYADNSGKTYVELDDKIRVVILYALRYANSEQSQLSIFMELLQQQALDVRDQQKLQRIKAVQEYYQNNYTSTHTVNTGAALKRNQQRELFENSMIRNLFRAVATELKGVENIYTQHKPWLLSVLNKLFSGDLKLTDYPYVTAAGAGSGMEPPRMKHKHVLVYMLGGVTYEEYAATEGLLHTQQQPVGPVSTSSTSSAYPPASHNYPSHHDSSPPPVPSTMRSASGGALSSSSSGGLSSSGSGGGSAAQKRFGDVLGGAFAQMGKEIANVAGTVGTAANAALKFNPRDYKVLLGGSCIHNSASFLHEILPIEEDLIQQKVAAMNKPGEHTVTIPSVEAAVNRQQQEQRGGPATTGGGGRGGPSTVNYAAVVRGRGVSSVPPPRGRGRGVPMYRGVPIRHGGGPPRGGRGSAAAPPSSSSSAPTSTG